MVKKIKEEEHKSSEHVSKSKFCILSNIKKNPWIASSIVLFVILVLVFFLKGSNVSGSFVSGQEAGNNLINFINSQGSGQASLVSSEADGALYNIVVDYEGQEIPVMVTLDGKYLITQPIPLTDSYQSTPTQTIPKSDKPKVELFIWGYCPYGVQAQGPVAEVASLLGNDADFEAVMYYDGHGPFETQQNKIQSCIQEIAPDKYWAYASNFVKDIYPKCGETGDIECDQTESVSLMKSLGINDKAVMSCVEKEGNSLLSTAMQRAQSYGVTGSPTIMINGVKANVARSAEAIKAAVCASFVNAPAECSTALNSDSVAASGNC